MNTHKVIITRVRDKRGLKRRDSDADIVSRHSISLYKGKECIERNVPETEAIPHLVALIKANGDWVDP